MAVLCAGEKGKPFSVLSSQFTVHSSRFTVRGSLLGHAEGIRDSRVRANPNETYRTDGTYELPSATANRELRTVNCEL
jgi:hypothetical protein